MSISVDGDTGNRQSSDPAISADGRWVAFDSNASDLVANDTNGTRDVFVRDRATGTTTRVSVSSTGGQLNGHSSEPAVSADGRVVVFRHGPFDTDIYVRDRDADGDGVFDEPDAVTTTAVTGTLAFTLYPAVSGDGRFVAFTTDFPFVPEDTNATSDVYVYDRIANRLVLVSATTAGKAANAGSSWPSLSRDGRFVAFDSFASDLVGGDLNGEFDVFVRDRDADGNGRFDEPGGVTTRLVSVSALGLSARGGSARPSLSADALRVAFISNAADLVAVDTNDSLDIFVRDLVDGGTTRRASVSSSGDQGDGGSDYPALSPDGRYVVFQSDASNLVPEDLDGGFGGYYYTDIFVRDLAAGTTSRASVTSRGGESNGSSFEPSVSAGGQDIAFDSMASNLTAEPDTNTSDGLPGSSPAADVFVRGIPRAPAMSLTAASATNGQYSDTAVVEARLSEGAVPLAGVPLTFRLGTQSATATTDGAGVARASLILTDPPGAYRLTVAYAGQAGAYEPAAAGGDFTVSVEDSAMSLSVASKKRVLTARLFDADTTTAGLGGRVVSFSADGVALGTAVSGADGVATLTPPANYQRGTHTYTARFAGDTYYRPSSATARR